MMNIKRISKEGDVHSMKQCSGIYLVRLRKQTDISLDNQCSGQHLNRAFSIHKPSESRYMTLLRDKCRWSEVERMSFIASDVYNKVFVTIRV
jgi:hypothetical protein